MQTLWNKGTQMPQEVKDFTVGNDLQWDKRLAVYDVKGSAAHVQMLGKTGLLTAPETEQLLDALKDIERSIREGTFHIPEGTEDIHSAIELELTEKLGPTGKNSRRPVPQRPGTDRYPPVFKRCMPGTGSQNRKPVPGPAGKKPGVRRRPDAGLYAFPAGHALFLWLVVWGICRVVGGRRPPTGAAWELCNQNPLGSAAGYGIPFP